MLKMVDGEPCHKVIREEFDAELPSDENATLDKNDPNDAKKILALKQNEQVMAMLMIAMNTDEGMCKVMQEMNHSPIFQTGKAWRVIKAIKEMSRPDDMVAKVEMDAEVGKITLKKGESPKVLLEKMANIEVKFGKIIDVEKKTGVVLKCGRVEYSGVMTMCTTQHKMTNNRAPTCEELIADMYMQWRINSNAAGWKNGKDEDVKETALAFTTNNNKTDAKCYYCGKRGHMANSCHKKANDIKNGTYQRNGNKGGGNKTGGGKFKGNCNHCGKPGHKEVDCRSKKAEAQKKKSNIAGGAVEILMACVDDMSIDVGNDDILFSSDGLLMTEEQFSLQDVLSVSEEETSFEERKQEKQQQNKNFKRLTKWCPQCWPCEPGHTRSRCNDREEVQADDMTMESSDVDDYDSMNPNGCNIGAGFRNNSQEEKSEGGDAPWDERLSDAFMLHVEPGDGETENSTPIDYGQNQPFLREVMGKWIHTD